MIYYLKSQKQTESKLATFIDLVSVNEGEDPKERYGTIFGFGNCKIIECRPATLQDIEDYLLDNEGFLLLSEVVTKLEDVP